MIRAANFDATNILGGGFFAILDIITIMATSKTRGDSLQLQERDLALLCGLFECRVMTAGHIATLYFDSNKSSCTSRSNTPSVMKRILHSGFMLLL